MKTADEDWFSFTLPKDGYISLTFGHESQIVGSSNYWATAFYTSDNSIIDAWTNWEGNTTVDGSTYKIGLPAGTYYLCVDKASSYSDQTYHFTVNFTASNVWEKERNDSLSAANQVPLNTEISGSLMKTADDDWYSFTLTADDTVTLVFGHDYINSSNSNSYWATAFYSSDNSIIGKWTYWAGNTTTDGTATSVSLAKGTYYLYVDKGTNYSSIPYHFMLRTATPAAPTLKASPAADSAVLKWTAISGATQYRVYRRDNESGTWSGWSTVASGVKTAGWTDEDVIPGCQYKYRVKAYVGGAWTDYSNAVSVAIPLPPELTVRPAAVKAVLTWTAVSGASQYRIYRRSNEEGSWSGWSMVKRLSSGTTWTDTDVIQGGKYKYQVRAYVGGAWTEYSNAVSISIPAPPALQATVKTGKIVATWTAVSGATQYRVYRRDNENGSWSDWSMVQRLSSGTTWTDTAVESGCAYKYRVRAYVGGEWTDYSNAVAVTAK